MLGNDIKFNRKDLNNGVVVKSGEDAGLKLLMAVKSETKVA